MTTNAPPPVMEDVRDDAIIARGLPCARCGYNLRGLRLDGRCPECGDAIAQSLSAWQERWLRVLGPARRVMLFFGAFVMLITAVHAQLQQQSADQSLIATVQMALAWIGVLLITAVRWDQGRWRWGGVPLAARIFTSLALAFALLYHLVDYLVGHPQWHFATVRNMMFTVIASTDCTVLATTMLYIHVARVANRLGWRFISWQAIALTLLMALGVAIDVFTYPHAHWTVWLLPGLGAREFLGYLIEMTRVGSFGRALAWLRWIAQQWLAWPMLLSIIGAAVLMLQLAFAAAARARPPKVLGD